MSVSRAGSLNSSHHTSPAGDTELTTVSLHGESSKIEAAGLPIHASSCLEVSRGSRGSSSSSSSAEKRGVARNVRSSSHDRFRQLSASAPEKTPLQGGTSSGSEDPCAAGAKHQTAIRVATGFSVYWVQPESGSAGTITSERASDSCLLRCTRCIFSCCCPRPAEIEAGHEQTEQSADRDATIVGFVVYILGWLLSALTGQAVGPLLWLTTVATYCCKDSERRGQRPRERSMALVSLGTAIASAAGAVLIILQARHELSI